MFTFKNIDRDYRKWRHEPIGEIQPKYWFLNNNNSANRILVKRQHLGKVTGETKKSKMYNHFGEFFGYKLARKANISVCPVELVTLHDTKNKYGKTKRLYTGCASKSVKKMEQDIYSGELVVSNFKMKNPESVKRILSNTNNIDIGSVEDNVDIILAAIANETRDIEEKMGIRTANQIEEDVKRNINDAVEMVVYDCIFGNSDRHSQNWSMVYDIQSGTVAMYPNYDNEAVLGFRKTEVEIKRAVRDMRNLSAYSEKELFSRMGFAPANSRVTYKEMLQYLVNRYPEYAIPAIKKITSLVSEKDVEDLYIAVRGITSRSDDSDELSVADELPSEFAVFGMQLYLERRNFARTLIERNKLKYKKELIAIGEK